MSTNGTISDVERDYEEYQKAGRVIGKIARDRIKKIKFPRIPDAIRERFLAIGDMSSVIADIMDTLGIEGAVAASHLKPILPWSKIVGTAATIRNIPERKTATQGHVDKDPAKMAVNELFLMCEKNDVLVLDFGGDLEYSNLGGNACILAQQVGLAGVVAYGSVRDAETMRDINFPVWSSGITPKTGKYRIEAVEMNGPVTIMGIVVHPGDLVVADVNGVCFVPAEHIERVLAAAEKEEISGNALRVKLENAKNIQEIGAAMGVKPR